MKKTIIGTAIIVLIGFVLKDAFYKSLCEQGKFACFLGWVAFKSPTLIIVLLILVLIYLWWKKEN